MIRIASSKGQLGLEILWVILVLVIVAVGLVFGLQPFKELSDDIQSESDMSDAAKSAAQASAGNASTTWDNVFMVLFILLWIFLIAAATFANTNPVLSVITLLFVVISLVMGMVLANVYQDAVSDAEVQDFKDSFPKMNWIIEHILLVSIFMGLSYFFVLFTRGS